jgi:hypothetical protein
MSTRRISEELKGGPAVSSATRFLDHPTGLRGTDHWAEWNGKLYPATRSVFGFTLWASTQQPPSPCWEPIEPQRRRYSTAMTFRRDVAASDIDRYVRISTTALWRGSLVSVMGFDHAGDVFIWGEVPLEIAREISRESDRLTILERWQVRGVVGFDELSGINEEISVIGS